MCKDTRRSSTKEGTDGKVEVGGLCALEPKKAEARNPRLCQNTKKRARHRPHKRRARKKNPYRTWKSRARPSNPSWGGLFSADDAGEPTSQGGGRLTQDLKSNDKKQRTKREKGPKLRRKRGERERNPSCGTGGGNPHHHPPRSNHTKEIGYGPAGTTSTPQRGRNSQGASRVWGRTRLPSNALGARATEKFGSWPVEQTNHGANQITKKTR